jgi:hypothetical protein
MRPNGLLLSSQSCDHNRGLDPAKSLVNTSRLIDTDLLGAHLDYFGFADNTEIGDLTGRSTEVNSGWPTKRALNDLRFLERKI